MEVLNIFFYSGVPNIPSVNFHVTTVVSFDERRMIVAYRARILRKVSVFWTLERCGNIAKALNPNACLIEMCHSKNFFD